MTETEECVRCTFLYEICTKGPWSLSCFRCIADGELLQAFGTGLPKEKNTAVDLFGVWTAARENGRKQFRVSGVQPVPVTDRDQAVAFLTGLRCGISRRRAEEIWNVFGKNTWKTVTQTPQELSRIPGITDTMISKIAGSTRKEALTDALQDTFRKSDMLFSSSAIRRIIETLGPDAEDILENDPYRLVCVDGFSFEQADRLAKGLGLNANSSARIEAGVLEVLRKAEKRGHVCYPLEDFRSREGVRQKGVLSRTDELTGAGDAECRQAVRSLHGKGMLVYAGGFLYRKERFEEEKSAAADIRRLITSPCGDQRDPVQAIEEYEAEFFPLSAAQRDAVRNVFLHRVSIITGGPGTGKTTVIRAILYVHRKLYGNASLPLLLAPTGKAASRMTEASGHPAQTVHSAVGCRDADQPADKKTAVRGNLILVDESSMLDLTTAALLLKKIPSDASVVFCGDPDQLPSVGCGNVLSDMIACGQIPTVRLDVLFRQKRDDPVAVNAERMMKGEIDLIFTSSFRMIEAETGEETFETACRVYMDCVNKYGIENVVLLNPQRRNTGLSVDRFNGELQKRVREWNVSSCKGRGSGPLIRANGHIFRIGDRVLQMKNTEESRNGETGVILDIRTRPFPDDPDSREPVAAVKFGPGDIRFYSCFQMELMDLAYAMTVHKAQGSEYRAVIEIVSPEHPAMLKRQLIYTGITRSKEAVILIGSRESLRYAIRNGAPEYRFSNLNRQIRALIKS